MAGQLLQMTTVFARRGGMRFGARFGAAAPLPLPHAALAARAVSSLAPRRAPRWEPRPADSPSARLLARDRRLARQGIKFQHLVAYLEEQYGLQEQVTQEPLMELAKILGYDSVRPETSINFSDSQILFEEVGALPATLREMRRFLRTQQREKSPVGSAADMEDFALEPEVLDEWDRLRNVKDLLAFARRQGAHVETLAHGQGWLRITTAEGPQLHFKNVGKKEGTRSGEGRQGRRKETPRSDKKVEIRLCTPAEEELVAVPSQSLELANNFTHVSEEPVVPKPGDDASVGAGEEPREAGSVDVFPPTPWSRAQALERKKNEDLQRRERSGQTAGPRRRGKSVMPHGRRSAGPLVKLYGSA